MIFEHADFLDFEPRHVARLEEDLRVAEEADTRRAASANDIARLKHHHAVERREQHRERNRLMALGLISPVRTALINSRSCASETCVCGSAQR